VSVAWLIKNHRIERVLESLAQTLVEALREAIVGSYGRAWEQMTKK